ncbi:glycoside hydrolase family 13 protein [Aaosphaeria arxii CBS 175.79]|uniref:Glycoside hydrolase family 13 protein n=1 Tax=Aaosphaeria arxii CBS 175.79 TaxID=1450172 RepID=A0A6A5XED2_9PLEO|nr:glycoside hydrolase family 13 protein [Aaosphaeria arxii CBS 175.79]KAF2011186.1 glycoside hydrolase family 13 protein [Aaosphaeria arxii CBS 175.79]
MVSSTFSVRDQAVQDVLLEASTSTNLFHPSPVAWEDQQLYFLLPDRFSNSREQDTVIVDGGGHERDVPPFKPSDNGNAVNTPNDAKAWEQDGIVFQGGTLQGIKSKIGYLKRLGITAIWVGPIFKQVPRDDHLYHGYAVQDFLDIEPHFGTKDDLRELVTSAHDEGIYVILDIILNHSGDVFAYKGGEKRWTGETYEVEGFRDALGKPTLPFKHMGQISTPADASRDSAIWPAELQTPETFTCEGAISNWDYWPEYIRGDFLTLKDIDLGSDNPDNFRPTSALLTLTEVYKYWVAFADLDGYRIDTVKHMGDGPTRYICTALHEFATSIGKENFFLVGEVTGGRAFDTVEITGLDAALAIGNIQEKLWKLPKGFINPAEYFDLFRNATFLKKGTNAWTRNKLVTMIDDHDQVWRGGMDKARFCSDFEGSKLILPALALNLTTLGIPCIYYGTEQYFDGKGGSDRYIREAMFGGSFGAFRSKGRHFFNESTHLFREVGKISALRQEYPALRRGRQYLREISKDGNTFGVPHILGGRMTSIVAWSRIFAGHEIVCAINTDHEHSIEAYVTIDSELHNTTESLKCLYTTSSVASERENEAIVINANGRAARLSVPACGFVMYS